MRRLLTFTGAGETLAASLDGASGTTGLLMATGGSQTRIGSHRMYERLAKALADEGYPCFRYDRRGVGDSGGQDPGFRGSIPDIGAAAVAFRREASGLERVIGFGLCDGATALALSAGEAGLDGLILVNPWLVEVGQDEAPPAAAVRRHYRQRLTSREGWSKLLRGAISWRGLLKGIRRISAPSAEASLALEAAAALRRAAVPVWLILAEGDATAIAAQAEVRNGAFQDIILGTETLLTDSHTFARPGDEAALLAAVARALKALAP